MNNSVTPKVIFKVFFKIWISTKKTFKLFCCLIFLFTKLYIFKNKTYPGPIFVD